MTPGSYLGEWRLGVAQSLLRQGKPVQLVSDVVGYGSASALSRAFRTQMVFACLSTTYGRLWPCGLSKQQARIDYWMKDIAPSSQLRKWYGHDISRWDEFKRRYFAELSGQDEQLHQLRKLIEGNLVTLLTKNNIPSVPFMSFTPVNRVTLTVALKASSHMTSIAKRFVF